MKNKLELKPMTASGNSTVTPPQELADDALVVQCNRAIDRDYVDRNGGQHRVSGWHPQWRGEACGGAGGFDCKLYVETFVWATDANGTRLTRDDGTPLRKVLSAGFADAREFLKSHRRVLNSDDACEALAGA